MAVMLWIYADQQARPVNYAELAIPYQDLTFFGFGGSSNYRTLMGERADEYGEQAFVTEYAAPTHELSLTHPLLQELKANYPYVTRLNTVISPDDMTVDPIFDYDSQRKYVSNIHDLSGWTGLSNCERIQSIKISTTDRTESATVGSIGVINTSATINSFFTPQVKPVIEPVVEPVVQPVPPASETNSSNLTENQSYFWTIIAASAVGGFLVLMVGDLVFAGVTLIRQNKS